MKESTQGTGKKLLGSLVLFCGVAALAFVASESANGSYFGPFLALLLGAALLTYGRIQSWRAGKTHP